MRRRIASSDYDEFGVLSCDACVRREWRARDKRLCTARLRVYLVSYFALIATWRRYVGLGFDCCEGARTVGHPSRRVGYVPWSACPSDSFNGTFSASFDRPTYMTFSGYAGHVMSNVPYRLRPTNLLVRCRLHSLALAATKDRLTNKVKSYSCTHMCNDALPDRHTSSQRHAVWLHSSAHMYYYHLNVTIKANKCNTVTMKKYANR